MVAVGVAAVMVVAVAKLAPGWIQMSGKRYYKITYDLLKTYYFAVKLFFALVILFFFGARNELFGVSVSFCQFCNFLRHRCRESEITTSRKAESRKNKFRASKKLKTPKTKVI